MISLPIRSTNATGSPVGIRSTVVTPRRGVVGHLGDERVDVVRAGRARTGSCGRPWRGRGPRCRSAGASTSSLWATSSAFDGEQVARVGVAGDEAQRLPFAAATDEDRRAGLADRAGRADRLGQLVVACPRRARRRRSTSAGRSAASPRAARTARPPAGTAPPGPRARARTTRRRCRAGPGRRTARRGWRRSWPADPGAGRSPR